MIISLSIPDPTSWNYIVSEDLKQRKKDLKEAKILMYDCSAHDEIHTQYNHTQKLEAFFNLAMGDKNRYDPPVIIEVKDVTGKPISVGLADFFVDSGIIHCKFWVLELECK